MQPLVPGSERFSYQDTITTLNLMYTGYPYHVRYHTMVPKVLTAIQKHLRFTCYIQNVAELYFFLIPGFEPRPSIWGQWQGAIWLNQLYLGRACHESDPFPPRRQSVSLTRTRIAFQFANESFLVSVPFFWLQLMHQPECQPLDA
ncbi:hypothetical protein STEG23_006179 [Scotinomys teguina]